MRSISREKISNDAELIKAIKRFVELDQRFPGAIRNFDFVSNATVLDTDADSIAEKSPLHLLRSVDCAGSWTDLASDAKKAFAKLQKDTGSNADALFAVLKRLHLVLGPSRDAFASELAQNHLPHIDDCKHLSAKRLAEVVDAAIDLVARASNLSCQDPENNYACLNREGEQDPQLKAKRLPAESLILLCRKASSPTFRYREDLTSSPLHVDTDGL